MATSKAPENTQETKAEQTDEKKFSVENLRKHCTELFGITQSTFDGALYGVKEKELTVSEAKTIIDTWLYGKKGGKK